MAFSAHYKVDYSAPTTPHVLAYIQYVRRRMKSPASIRNVIGSLSTAFKRMGLDHGVFSSFQVNMALKSLEVNSRYISTPKLPITHQELDSVILAMRAQDDDPAVICAIAFAFTGLLRQSNIAPRTEREFDSTRHLTRGDIKRVKGGIEVKVKWTKTIQKAQDATSIVLPPIPGREFCPISALDAMLKSAPRAASHAPLFVTRAGRILPLGFLKRAWQRAIKAVGLPAHRLSLHSLRSGGATAAWGSGTVSELDLMRHGTWASTAWKGYVRPSHSSSTVLSAFTSLKK